MRKFTILIAVSQLLDTIVSGGRSCHRLLLFVHYSSVRFPLTKAMSETTVSFTTREEKERRQHRKNQGESSS